MIRATKVACCLTLCISNSALAAPTYENISGKVIEALAAKMNFDNYWFGTWSEQITRRVRLLPLPNTSYLVAFEVTSNDFPRSAEISWQMAFVHLGRESPLVQFPGMPCSPEALLSALDVHPEVAKRDIVAIQTANGCIETRFALRRRDRSYQHSQNWKSMVAALEKELQTFISEHRIHEGVVVIHDLIDTDEEFEGLGLFENGKACYSLSGELLRSRSVTNPASCILRAQPEQAQNTDHLAKLLTAPLLWRVHSVNGKSVLARESSQWNRKGSVTTHRSSTL